MSRRGIHFPMIRYWLGFLSSIFLRSSSERARVIGTFATISPYGIDRPVGRGRIRPSLAAQSPTATFICLAAAAFNSNLAPAPPRDRERNGQFTDQPPPLTRPPISAPC